MVRTSLTASTRVTRSTPCYPPSPRPNRIPENSTIAPIPGDVAYSGFGNRQLNTASHGYEQGGRPQTAEWIVDFALFYERNNILLNPDTGWFPPGNIFATITDGLPKVAAAGQDLWMSGVVGEPLVFHRA